LAGDGRDEGVPILRILSIHVGYPPRACRARLPLRIIAAPDRNGARPAGVCSNDPREPPARNACARQGRAGNGIPAFAGMTVKGARLRA